MMRRRAVLILIFAAVALCVSTFAASSLPGPARVIGVYDGTDDKAIPDHSPALLPAVPTLPGVLSASLEGSQSVQPAIFRTVDPFGSRAPPPSNLLSAGSNPFRQLPE